MKKNERLEKLLGFLEKSPNDSFLLYGIALEYSAINELDLSEKYFIKLHSIDTDYLALYYHYGILLIKKENYTKAQDILKKGLEVANNQKDTKTWNEINELLESLEDALDE